jgi:hypothetical protein
MVLTKYADVLVCAGLLSHPLPCIRVIALQGAARNLKQGLSV